MDEHTALMQRALDAALLGPEADPNPRVGCVLTARDGHVVGGGLPPRRRHRARRGRRPRAGRGRRARGHRRRHPRAVQPHRPHRAVHRGAARGRRRRRRLRPARPQPGRRRGSGAAAPRPGSRSTAACCAARREPLNRAWTFAVEHRAPLRHLEVRHHPRRPQRRRRRHQPLGHRGGRPRGHPPAARPGATRCWSAPAPCSPTTPRSPCDDADEPLPGAQPLRVGDGAARRCRPARRVLDDAAETAGPRDPRPARRRWPPLSARGRQHVFLEGGPTLAAAFLRAGLVDEVVAYVAPMLLGAGAAAVGDLGITTITDALRLETSDVTVARWRRAHHRPTHDDEGADPCSPASSRSSAPSPPSSEAPTPSGSPSTVRSSRPTPRSATPSPSTAAASPSSSTEAATFTADVMAETLTRPASAALAPGDRVNLERAVTPRPALRRPHRAGPRRRHGHGDRPRARRALGGRRDRLPGRSPATSSRRARSPSTASR